MTDENRDRIMEGKKQRQGMMNHLGIDEATAYTFSPPEEKDAYVVQLQTRLEDLKSAIDRLASAGDTLEQKARADLEQETERLTKRYDTAKNRLAEIKNAGDDAWNELRKGSLNAWYDLAQAVKKASEKFA